MGRVTDIEGATAPEAPKSKRGGRREGAGRKATGRKACKTITVQLTLEEYAVLEQVAKRGDFVREAIMALGRSRGLCE